MTMNKYLDQNGLSTLWSRTKEYFSEQTDNSRIARLVPKQITLSVKTTEWVNKKVTKDIGISDKFVVQVSVPSSEDTSNLIAVSNSAIIVAKHENTSITLMCLNDAPTIEITLQIIAFTYNSQEDLQGILDNLPTIENVVSKNTNETINGIKTFSNQIIGSIDKAEKDLNGNIITSTYATKTELNSKQGSLTDEQLSTVNSGLTSTDKATIDSLSTVATSGNYNDLTNKPTIPTVNNATLTIQKNGSNVKTFTANASSNVTCNITVPTKTSDLTNDSNFITDVSNFETKANAITSLSVNGKTITITKGDNSTSTITTQDTTYSVATTSKDGLLSKNDKEKLDGLSNYVLPNASSTLGGVKTTSTVTSTSGLTASPIIDGVVYYKDTNTTYTSMTSTEATSGTSTTARSISAKVLNDKITASISTKANDTDVVHLASTETISGDKTFSGSVTLPSDTEFNITEAELDSIFA